MIERALIIIAISANLDRALAASIILLFLFYNHF